MARTTRSKNKSQKKATKKETEIAEKNMEVKNYDFRTPKKATKETLKLMRDIYDNYCRLLANRLTMMLRTSCEVKIDSVEETTFYGYIENLSDYTSMGMLEVKYPNNQVSDYNLFYDIPRNLLYLYIDKLLGGDGGGSVKSQDREYTDIEITLINYIYDQIAPVMDLAWQNTLEMKTEFVRMETKYRLGQYVNYNDTVIIIRLQAAINGETGKITICFPLGHVNEILSRIKNYAKHFNDSDKRNTSGENKDTILGSLKNSELTITGVLDKTKLTFKEITELQVGDLLVLDKDINSPIDVYVEGDRWYAGKWGAKNNKNVVKITKNFENRKGENLLWNQKIN